MKKIIIVTLTLLMVCPLIAQEHNSYQFTLEDCLHYAFAHSYERQSMALNAQ